ncbi:alpha/beta fold hydrolase [Methanocella sp. MCL-LM]|uniref:alpha/beta fold hydrolase n=1 Tax=Methanocella sp. MCL-LM TaxID=3412035 RepID=UPI003C75711B
MTLYMTEAGPADAPSVLFLHGGGMSGWMWDNILRLMQDYHCIVPDLPDHGGSRGESPFAHEKAAALIAETIKARAHGGKAHVVGVSLGAQVLLELLAAFPEVVDHAVVNSPELRPVPGSGLMLHPLLFDPTVKLTIPLARNKSFARLQARSYHLPEDMFEAYFEDTRQTRGEVLARILRANMTYKLPAALKEVNVPVLALVGGKEYGMMKASARDVAATLPNGRGYVVPGVGHTFSFEKPELYARLVRDWINDRPLPENELVKL